LAFVSKGSEGQAPRIITSIPNWLPLFTR